MATRIVECTDCGQKNISKLATCSRCGASLRFATGVAGSQAVPKTPTHTKPCSYCGEEILAVAKKCKHCQTDLTTAADGIKVDYGTFLLAIPVIGSLLCWFWIAELNLLQGPSEKLALVGLATVVGTALLAAQEASRVGMKSDRTLGTYSPFEWFLSLALLWVISYPVYLYKRRLSGLPNLLVAGLLVTVMFLGSTVVVGVFIEKRKAEVREQLEPLIRAQKQFGG